MHVVLALAANLPFAHAVQSGALSAALNLPLGQSVQLEWPPTLKRPAAHSVHTDEPEAPVYLPAPQSSQTSRVEVLNLPAGQAAHSQLPPPLTFSTEYLPLGQTVHTPAPGAENCPGEQSVGWVALSAEKLPHTVVAHEPDPAAVLYSPSEQGVHAFAPATLKYPASHTIHAHVPALLYCPATHCVQELRPTSAWKVPEAQLVHSPAPSALYLPQEQESQLDCPVPLNLPAGQ